MVMCSTSATPAGVRVTTHQLLVTTHQLLVTAFILTLVSPSGGQGEAQQYYTLTKDVGGKEMEKDVGGKEIVKYMAGKEIVKDV